jgi:NitT/TauT family transport system permease protein
MTHPLATRLASLAVMLGLFLAWEAFCRFFAINPFVLPKPSEVVMALITRFPALIPHAAQTMTTTMIGFLLGATVGVFLGVVTGISRVAYQIVSPLPVSLSSIPKVALVTIFVMWFGARTLYEGAPSLQRRDIVVR